MREQRLLDLGAGDVVAGGDDHVVATGLVPEVAFGVLDERVPGDVPPVLHVKALSRVSQVAAASRSLDRQSSCHAWRLGLAEIIEDRRDISGYGAASGAGSDVVISGGDEYVQHLGGADA